MTTNFHLDAELLIKACALGQLEQVRYYLDNFSYAPEIYSKNNKCLYEAFFNAKNEDVVLLLCEKVPTVEYFESSVQNWANNSTLLKIITNEKNKRYMKYLHNVLPEKSSNTLLIKI